MSNEMSFGDFITFLCWFTIIFVGLWIYIAACFRAAKKNPALRDYYARSFNRQRRTWGNRARRLGEDVEDWWQR